MNNKHDSVSAKEALKLNLRAIRTIYATRKKVLALRLTKFAFAALTPYVGIRLSALLLDELAGARDPKVLTALVLWIIGSAAGITLIQSLLDRWHDGEQAGMYIHIDHIMSGKMASMDYADVEDTETYKLLSVINQSRQGGGWGLHHVTHNLNNLWSSLFSLGGGVALTVTLFTTPVPEGSDLAFLNSPWVTAGVILLFIAVSLAVPAMTAVCNRQRAKVVTRHNLSNRLFSYYGRYGDREETAVDARIYDLGRFCDKYNFDKTNLFSSKGYFAKLNRGKLGFLSTLSAAASVLFTGLVYLYVCVKGWAGAFGVGAVTQYVGAVTMLFAGSFRNILSELSDMKNNAYFLKLVFKFLDIPNRMYQGSLTVEKRRDRDYEIEFKNVSFKYPGADTYALKNVSLKFKVGQRLAVVGRNGSGKTTFIKLLCRLYDPTEGEILLNGIDIRKYDYKDYMGVFSVVFQDFRLFSLPVGENVAGKVDYHRALAESCIRDSGLGDRLDSLEQGLDTFLGKDYETGGIDLSGGEKQKLALARALYKNAPFIILDEPTAALDPVAEAEVYQSFDKIVGDKTAIYISHRLSSCRFCDVVAVFDGGALVQMGSHDDLVADENGQYYKLWHAQAQYYTESNT